MDDICHLSCRRAVSPALQRITGGCEVADDRASLAGWLALGAAYCRCVPPRMYEVSRCVLPACLKECAQKHALVSCAAPKQMQPQPAVRR